MVTNVKVTLWGEDLGRAQWDEASQSVLFQYEPSFAGKGIEPAPLKMPCNPKIVYTFPELKNWTYNGLPGLLADSLPDAFGRELMEQWLKRQGRESANPVERLCYQGKRSMGALEFEPVLNSDLESESRIEVDSLVNIAAEALSKKESLNTNISAQSQALLDIIKVGTSAGGQRAKAVIALNDKTGEIKSGQIDAPEGFDYWLLKLDGVSDGVLTGPKHYGELEYSYYKITKACGIDMMESRLYKENGRSHFLTKRFDRKEGRKIHTQTLCAMEHMDFQKPFTYSYEDAFRVMRALHLPYSDAEELFRRMVFNVIGMNLDDHTKNITFLLEKGGEWRLSPAYDMGYAYNPNGGWTAHHQMSINGKRDDITRSDMMSVADAMHIKHAKKIIDDIEDVFRNFEKYMEPEIPEIMISKIKENIKVDKI